MCLSWQSNTVALFLAKRKQKILHMVHSSPYSEKELECWKGLQMLKRLEEGKKFALDINSTKFEYYVDCVPILATYFIAAAHEEDLKLLFNEFTGPLKACIYRMDSEELAIFEKILAGESKKYDTVLSNSPNIMEIGRMTYSTEEGRLRLYSLYLANLSFEWLLARKDDLKLKNKLLHIKVWNSAIRSDLEVKPHNSARLGWNAEAITIGVIELHGIKEKQDVKFKIVKRYRVKGFHNFVTMSHADKSEGILLVPSAFNEECVDLVYVKKLEDGWTLLGIQISVAAWKTKKQHESDNSWAHLAMHSCWVPPGEKIKEVRFLYIMRKEEIQESRKMEEKSRTLRSGTVIVASEIQADWVSFAGVHSELKFLMGF